MQPSTTARHRTSRPSWENLNPPTLVWTWKVTKVNGNRSYAWLNENIEGDELNVFRNIPAKFSTTVRPQVFLDYVYTELSTLQFFFTFGGSNRVFCKLGFCIRKWGSEIIRARKPKNFLVSWSSKFLWRYWYCWPRINRQSYQHQSTNRTLSSREIFGASQAVSQASVAKGCIKLSQAVSTWEMIIFKIFCIDHVWGLLNYFRFFALSSPWAP